VKLVPDGLDGIKQGELRATVTNVSDGRAAELGAEVHLTAISESFISNDKLIAMGDAGRAQAVVVLDLLTKREVDWFYCYRPRRISDDWIVYIEFYPAHGTGEPTDVVLLYDLKGSPMDNRLERTADQRFPPSYSDNPIHVGIPIYPPMNASQRSYENHVASGDQSFHILGTPMVLLPSKKLILDVSESLDSRISRNYLASVDLSGGTASPVSRSIDIPWNKLPKAGENPQHLAITGMEALSQNAVRIYVPEREYGVSSIVVDIPNR
jgi:hypothetical protein